MAAAKLLEPRSQARTTATTADVSLCVINYNGASLLRDTLAAALRSRGGFREIILVDNASTDASVSLVEREFPTVRVVRLPDNAGPGAARNAGLGAARTDRVLFVDNDVLLTRDCAARLDATLDAWPSGAIAVPRVLHRNNPQRIQYDGADSHFLGLLAPLHAEAELSSAPGQVRPTGSLISACFLVDRRRPLPATLFDEAFFIYQEDHDLGLRTRIAGGDILAVPDALCHHGDGTAGLSLRSTGRHHPLRVEATIRNRWLVLLQNYERRTLLLLSPALLGFELVQLAGVVKKGWTREWWSALRHTIARRREIAERRRQVQQARVLPDRLLLRGGPLPFTAELSAGRTERAARSAVGYALDAWWRGVRRWL